MFDYTMWIYTLFYTVAASAIPLMWTLLIVWGLATLIKKIYKSIRY